MAGQPDPPILLEAFAKNATVCTQAAPVAGGKVVPLPQTTPGASGGATLDAGFGAINMTDPASGGVPPSGPDMNGILFISTGNVAALAAGQLGLWSSTLSTAMGGYRQGAVLTKADRSGLWFNQTDGNTSNPDTGGTGWVDWIAGGIEYVSANLTSGTTVNWAPSGFNASTGFLDVNPNAGASTLSGLIAGINGQTVTVSNVNGTNNLTFLNNDSGSSAANRFRTISAGFTLAPGLSATLRYSTGVNLWIIIT